MTPDEQSAIERMRTGYRLVSSDNGQTWGWDRQRELDLEILAAITLRKEPMINCETAARVYGQLRNGAPISAEDLADAIQTLGEMMRFFDAHYDTFCLTFRELRNSRDELIAFCEARS